MHMPTPKSNSAMHSRIETTKSQCTNSETGTRRMNKPTKASIERAVKT